MYKDIKLKVKKKINLIRIVNRSGRGLVGSINVRHRQTPTKSYYIKYSQNIFYSRFLIISNFFNFYKKRIPITELIDRFGNYYYQRRVSGLEFGEKIKVFPREVSEFLDDYLGTRSLLRTLLSGYIFCNFSNKKIASSPGTYCTLISNEVDFNLSEIILPSGQKKIVNSFNLCSIGRISNENSFREIYGKAGIIRNLGKRPAVRGVAMNPVDHPHGGRTKTNSPEKSPWGWVTKHSK